MSITFVVFLSLLALSSNPALSDPRATLAALICSTNNTASQQSRSAFIANFLEVMNAVTPQISRNRYAAVEAGDSAATAVYAFGECLRDLSGSDCDLCFARIKTQIIRCLPFQLATRGGRLFFDGCYIRYDDHHFFNQTLSDRDTVVCSQDNATADRHGASAEISLALVRNLSSEAPRRDGYFAGALSSGNVTVYGLAQCWRFVRGRQCEQCLAGSAQKVGPCLGAREARVLNAGCYLRYSDQKFYDNSTSDASSAQRNNGPLAIILAVTCAGFALLLTSAAVGFFLWKRVLKKRRERRQLGALLNTVNKSRLNFSYETLEKATDYFNESNKLGQGGSGSVYKGILPDGKTVAIKRLFFNTTQWVDHFFNEVNLISGIRHKNLVELLGCSITGPESLLVYEFVQNLCLHDNLFGAKKNVPLLSWESRYKIVSGTAEGLAYLHEESSVRIIHRDIKLSNVLLDENLDPKIADFGLARLFPEDKTHISTGIAGTLGYMAPEYIVRGKLSEKADVYSFGVLVIEVVCGRKNSSFNQNSHSVLQMVWNLYGTGKLSEAVDPRLEGQFETREASRLLQIGLVCVQASAELRPSMSSIVEMIGENQEIPDPTQPPFLHSNSVEIVRGVRSREYKSQQEDSSSNTQSSGNTITESFFGPR